MWIWLIFAIGACGQRASDDTSAAGSLKQTGDGPCAEPSECEGGVCVELIDSDNPPVYCTQPCDNGCPSGFVCDTELFALVDIDFCRWGDSPEDTQASPPEGGEQSSHESQAPGQRPPPPPLRPVNVDRRLRISGPSPGL